MPWYRLQVSWYIHKLVYRLIVSYCTDNCTAGALAAGELLYRLLVS